MQFVKLGKICLCSVTITLNFSSLSMKFSKNMANFVLATTNIVSHLKVTPEGIQL